jgi:hypothetical protein
MWGSARAIPGDGEIVFLVNLAGSNRSQVPVEIR